MAGITITAGVLLILLGIGGYIGTGFESWTALIPAGIGLVLAALGLAARKEKARKLAIHVAMLIALLGVIGSLMQPFKEMRSDAGLSFDTATTIQLVTAGVCITLIVLGVRSFITARRSGGGAD